MWLLIVKVIEIGKFERKGKEKRLNEIDTGVKGNKAERNKKTKKKA